MILHVLIAMIAGWIQRHQQHVITYLQVHYRTVFLRSYAIVV